MTEDDIRYEAARAREGVEPGEGAVVRGVLYLPGDELVFCLFDADSRTSAKRASEGAGIPCERVIESVWLDLADQTFDS
jgi:hypothetical protein